MPSAEETQFLTRRRRLRRTVVVLALLLGSISLFDQIGVFDAHANDVARLNRTEWTVTGITDALRLELRNRDDAKAIVQLLGVDLPTPGAHWADRARNYAVARALNKPVTLVFDGTRTRNASGQLLGYVYLSDSESLNFALVRDGQAYADRRVKHSFAGPFEQAENVVRNKGSGLWAALRFEQMPAWRQQWLRDIASARRGDSKLREE